MAETRQTQAHSAAREDSRALSWLRVPWDLPSAQSKVIMLYAIMLGYILAGASSRPGQRQPQQGHRSWEKAQLLTDFIY